jgi:peptide/nickel transport system permease protein
VTLLRQACSSTGGRVGLSIVGVFAVLALGAWLGLLGQGWSEARGGRWEGPGAEFWLGTNVLGQDIFQRALHSVGTAFEIGLVVSLASVALGAATGALSGWYQPRWPDGLLTWCMNVLDAIPFYLFVAAVAYALHDAPGAMHLAMIATFWTSTARLVRAETLKIRGQDFVLSARAIGLPAPLLLLRHVIPNTSHILLVQLGITFVAAVKTEVILSFLGIGVQDGVSWGLMLAESTQEVLAGHFNNFLAASSLLFLLVLGFSLLTDSLQRALDPRQGPA